MSDGIDVGAMVIQLKKAHIRLMRHPETCGYSGVCLMGTSTVEDKDYTAYTDGKNKKYSAAFLKGLTLEEVTGLALHENLHVLLKHMIIYRYLMKEDAQLANAAMDYVVNDIIMSIEDKTLCKLPKEGLYDAKFHNWNVRNVYDYLKTGKHNKDKPKPQGQGQGQGQGQPQPSQGKPERSADKVTVGGDDYSIGGMDQHDMNGEVADLDEEGIKELSEEINTAIRQGGMLAGKFGAKLPRQVMEVLEVKVNWKRETQEFVKESSAGLDEYTWARFDRNRLADDYFLPDTESETLGEWVIAIDTSGSMDNHTINYITSEVQAMCDLCKPQKIRVLWWDTSVHGEQVFEEDYTGLNKLFKPLGGGGTRVGCVSEYVENTGIKADCLLVITDGYVEGSPVWNTRIPTLWMVTHNEMFTPPNGARKVFIDKEV